MRIKVAALLTLSLIFGSTPAHAAVKANSACSVLGKKVTVNKTPFVCSQSGKKPKWKIQKPSKPSIEQVKPLSLDNLEVSRVVKAAYDEVIKELKKSPRSNFQPTYYLSPNLDPARASREEEGLRRAIDLWAPYYLPEKIQVIYAVGSDGQWVDAKVNELGLASMVPPAPWGPISKIMKSNFVCGNALAGQSASGIPTFFQCLDPGTEQGGYRQTGPHEYTHLFQMKYYGWKTNWYMEGAASYFGWTLGFYPGDENAAQRRVWVKQMGLTADKNTQGKISSRKDEELLQVFKSLESTVNSQNESSISYFVGSLATEVLIALYGFEKFIEFSKSFENSRGLSANFESIYGVSLETFYTKLAHYIWANL